MMAAPKEIKKRALELNSQGLSAEKVVRELEKESPNSMDIPCPKTIYRWRKEKPATKLEASEVLVLERMREHFDYLIGIAKSLLDNVYLWGHDPENIAARLSQRYNFLLAEVYSLLDWESFESHLKEEYPDLAPKTMWDIIDEDPVGTVRILELIVKRGAFTGTCPVCQDW